MSSNSWEHVIKVTDFIWTIIIIQLKSNTEYLLAEFVSTDFDQWQCLMCTSIILCFSKQRLTQLQLEKWPLKQREREVWCTDRTWKYCIVVALLLIVKPYVHRAQALSIDDRCLSVCPIPDPKSRTEWHSKLKIGRKNTGDLWPH